MRDENCICGETTVDPYCIVCVPSKLENCYYCGEPVDSFAGDPGKWQVLLPHSTDPGVMKSHHIECVTDILERFDMVKRYNGNPCNHQQKTCQHNFVPSSPETQEQEQYSGLICSKCKFYPQGWYCPDSPDHSCSYEDQDYDSCDYCGQPEERK